MNALSLSQSEPRFDRPIIIVAAPRSGSTLLFETLQQCPDLWSIGRESHAIFEQIPYLNPARGGCESNYLDASHARLDIITHIRKNFRLLSVNRNGEALKQHAIKQFRFLEKTPKNSLRIDFLNQLFPDAIYVYLTREVKQNLSSMIESWRSGQFRTYPNLPHWQGPWSLMLPPEYGRLLNQPLERIVAYQWFMANNQIINDLQQLPRNRVVTLQYDQLLGNTQQEIEKLCRACDLNFDEHLKTHCQDLPLSKTTQTAPSQDKWKKNSDMIEAVLPLLETTVARINTFTQDLKTTDELSSQHYFEQLSTQQVENEPLGNSKDIHIKRNDPCYCGSGLRYKRCHGKN